MELTKIYTTILHDPSEGHVVRYVQLPFGLSAASTSARRLVDNCELGPTPDSRVIAIIPGRHAVGFGDEPESHTTLNSPWAL